MKKSVAEIVTAQIIDALKTGVAPWQKGWLNHQNMSSARPYQGLLNMLILEARARSQGYDSPLWVTRKQAWNLGGNVRSGERYTTITYWNPAVVGTDKATGEPITRPVLRFWQAYNIDQTEGLNAVRAKFVAPANGADFAKADGLVAEFPAPAPTIEHNGQRAYYRPNTDTVCVPTKGSFKTREEYFSTLFHELVHSTGTKNRLGRPSFRKDGLSVFGSEDYSQEELTAELGSAYLCAEAGISAPVLANQAAYVAGWLKTLGNDPNIFIRAACAANKAVRYIQGTQYGSGSDSDE